jgi:hypothetical protein
VETTPVIASGSEAIQTYSLGGGTPGIWIASGRVSSSLRSSQ